MLLTGAQSTSKLEQLKISNFVSSACADLDEAARIHKLTRSRFKTSQLRAEEIQG